MSRSKKGGNGSKQDKFSDFPASGEDGEGNEAGLKEADFYENLADSQDFGEPDEGPAAQERTVAEILKLIDAVKADVLANKDKISGLIMVCGWDDAHMTHGWSGHFDPGLTAGKLFNLATDFSVYSAMQRLGGPSISKESMN